MATVLKTFLQLLLDEELTEKQINDFTKDNKFVLDTLLGHPKLKVNLVFNTLWKFFFGYFAPESKNKQFIHDTSIVFFNDGLIDVILHSPSFEFVKNISNIYNVDHYKAYIEKMKYNIDDKSYIKTYVVTKICQRLGVQCEHSMLQENPLMLYIRLIKALPNAHSPKTQEYTNPISKHSIIPLHPFKNNYNTDKIQEAIVDDKHFLVKLLNQPCICIEYTHNITVIKELLELFKKEKKRPVVFNLTQTDCSSLRSLAYVFDTSHEYIEYVPSVCEKFILVSNKRYPQFKSLARDRKHSLYYLHVLEETDILENAHTPHQKSYDHCVTSIPYKMTTQTSMKIYRIPDPLATGLRANNTKTTVRILVGQGSVGNPKIDDFGPERQVDVYTKVNKRTDYDVVIDIHNEIPMNKIYELGAKNIVIHTPRKLPKFNICSPLVFSKQMFEKLWRSHLSVECPHGNPNNPLNNMILFDEFILNYCDTVTMSPTNVFNKDAKNTVVLIDNRENALSVLSVYFALANVAKDAWACKVFTSRAAFDYYSGYLSRFGAEIVHLEELENTLFDIDVYNGIMKDPGFWDKVGGEKMLIIQDDGFLMKKGVERFLEFDYVGAPWADVPTNEYIKKNVNKDLVGNGGLSLRDVSKCKHITQKYETEKYTLFSNNIVEIPEDVYFVQYMIKEGFKVANIPNASFFASEQVLHPGAIGMHKPWPYTHKEHLDRFFATFL